MGFALEKIGYTTELYTITCGECGTPFAMDATLYEKKRQEQATFYCPNGHCRRFIGKTDVEKLREQLAEQGRKFCAELDLRLQRESELARLKKRVGNGTCPCCKRSFSNLHRHMKNKHPQFEKPPVTNISKGD